MIHFTSRSVRAGTTFADELIRATRPQIRSAAEKAGRLAQDNILAIIATTYGARKGKARSEPLATRNNYAYTVNTSRRGAQLNFRPVGTAKWKAKFGALNFGTTTHTIAPINAPALSNPADNFFSRRPVEWYTTSGKFGRHFFEEGIQQALDRFGSLL